MLTSGDKDDLGLVITAVAQLLDATESQNNQVDRNDLSMTPERRR